MKLTKGLGAALVAIVLSAGSANAANIVQTAAKAGTFNTLIAAAKAAGLAGALSRKAPLTVFAPTDEAFSRLPAGTVKSLLKPENKHKLAAILSYHVVPERITSKQIPRGRTDVQPLNRNARALRVRKNNAGVRVNRAKVIAADIRADNGVIHVIDRVLMPRGH